jgi:hypothetical protein
MFPHSGYSQMSQISALIQKSAKSYAKYDTNITEFRTHNTGECLVLTQSLSQYHFVHHCRGLNLLGVADK